MIKINSLLNQIKTEENINNNNSNLKKLFFHYQKELILLQRQYELLNHNYNFCYSGEDLLYSTKYSEDLINDLTSIGYKETILDKYSNEEYNCIHKINEIKYKKSNLEKKKINFFNGVENIQLDYLFEDNIIIFYNQLKVYFEFDLGDYKIKDLFIENNLVYLLLYDDNYHYLVLTTLGHYLNDIKKQNLYMIKTQFDFDSFINIEQNKIVLLNQSTKKLYELTLGKLYYFEHEDKLYFKQSKKIKNNGFETVQVESLFLYDVIHLFGLSDYCKQDNKYFNSINYNKKELLYINLFNDTKNGLINFHNELLKDSLLNQFIEITGNLNLQDYPNDKMLLRYTKLDKQITLELYYQNKLIKSMNIKESENIYFANLKIQTNVFTEQNYSVDFEITNNNLSINELLIDYSKVTNNTKNYINLINNNYITESKEKVMCSFEFDNHSIKDLYLLKDNKIKHFDEILIAPEMFLNTEKELNFDLIEKKFKINYRNTKHEYLKIKKHNFSYKVTLEV